jgi:hypothetical protein
MDPLDRQIELVNRLCRLAGRVLDQSANRASVCGQADRLGHASRCIGIAILQVGVQGQVSRRCDRATVGDRFMSTDGQLAIPAPQRVGKAEAGRRQCLEAQACK